MRPVFAALLPMLVVAAPALAEVKVETLKIDRKSETVEIEMVYPKTGIATLDKTIADWVEGMVAEFEAGAKADFADFTAENDGELPPWTYSLYLGFDVARNDAAMLVFDFDESIYQGGAHPNHDIITYNLTMPDAWQVYLPEIFAGQPALERISALAVADLGNQLLGPDSMSDPDWVKSGAGPQWSNFQDFLLLEDRLVIRFPPYQVAAYAAGEQKVEIPLASLSGLMRTNWHIPVASFDCARAASATEKAICSDVALARLDRRLSDSYAQAVSWASDETEKAAIRTAQRQWIGVRDACGGDGACLTAAYESRIKALAPT